VKRREAIGGVTIAVVGIVLALSVGIAATAKGGVFSQGPNGQALAGAPGAATAVRTASAKPATTRVLVKAVVSQTAAAHRGLCTVDTHIVTTMPAGAGRTRVSVVRSLGGRVRRHGAPGGL
jgi:hypothetical protein